MKKKMKRIFIISVLFIIVVGLYGIFSGNNKYESNNKRNNMQSERLFKSDELEEAKNSGSTKSEVEPEEDNTQNDLYLDEDTQLKENRSVNIESKVEKTEKEQYIERLDSIVTYYNELWNKSDSLAMTDMKELKNQEYTKWDDELNTIYQMIKKKLSEEEFISLRDEERKWITTRDEKSELAASKYAGGSMEGLEYMAVMTDITRERTYELVDIYFEE